MAELADALDLGSSVNRRAGSTPVIRISESADFTEKNSRIGTFLYASLKWPV